MTEPSLALQGAVIARLKADADVAALVGARIYDHAPPNAAFPYISLGPDQVIDDSTDCHDDVEVFTTFDIWSRANGRVEAKRIAHAVRQSLNGADFTLSDNAMVMIEHRTTRVMTDPDGITTHAVIDFRSLIQAA